MQHKIIDHLFRHHYGKMVAILTRFFGLAHIETIEDAVQDTFIKATLQWRNQRPDNPEAWLTKVAKNRTIDLLRSLKSEKNRHQQVSAGTVSIPISDLFLDHEIEDSQLRMIFVACHPSLKPQEQIAFALKTISGFSTKEIAAALLTREDAITKRLQRARAAIVANNIQFEFPAPHELQIRLTRVMEVIYLTFNEGFHSTNADNLIREDLCGEAIRLSKLLLKKEKFRSGSMYALFALMCFHAARLESKTNSDNEIVDIRNQDRNKWHVPMIELAKNALTKSAEYKDVSIYHFEATIAFEHVKAVTFEDTNWNIILHCYNKLYEIQPSDFALLNKAIVTIQLNKLNDAKDILESIKYDKLGQRQYLYYGCYAEYYAKMGAMPAAIAFYEKAITKTSNALEKAYLLKKKNLLQASN
ncbi:sigma-70 family RNA polymerase sigma factor [Aurantibacter crassamenti]|uniref:RNA polymerase sigma factor n=1 Tax=Aurantibacter crassamenti TaxID=1837375 RepID=UPI0019396052|nr:sigma-70 family RNA polymerase sigma factor [Aurantibacter crassamenti]MBM1105277.1 sigma-70 family RNA polymerase sigma factor [Aurantibacter crassamenti]